MLLLFLALLAEAASGALPPTCDSQVYCQGELLQTVQMAKVYQDSKTFVDLKIKTSEKQVLANFDAFMKSVNDKPTDDEVGQFVKDNFEEGQELEEWVPPDFNPEPDFLKEIQNSELRNFGMDIVALWKILARKTSSDVEVHPDRYSLLALPNGFIIPGGRFKEIYYWDTYWIIRGLLISGMHETARGMIENLIYLVRVLGHVPNGSRVYYTRRSQPPLLTKMVTEYIRYTKNYTWLEKNIDALETELIFWLENRAVWVRQNKISYRLFRYHASTSGPRPESYREDVETTRHSPDPQKIFTELKSGSESGWDFSSRWFFDPKGGNHGNLSNIHVSRAIPVDLNAFLFDAFASLSNLFAQLGNGLKRVVWNAQASVLELGISNVLWDDKEGIWFDYDIEMKQRRPYFYASNLAPLATDKFAMLYTQKVLKYLERNNITMYPGGTPTSFEHTGEQWDFPNAWPPLQSILIFGLAGNEDPRAQDLGLRLAQNWVSANYIGFRKSKEMFEKYDALEPGKYGGGGEYVVQAGFGWTNGVVLELLDFYKDRLKVL